MPAGIQAAPSAGWLAETELVREFLPVRFDRLILPGMGSTILALQTWLCSSRETNCTISFRRPTSRGRRNKGNQILPDRRAYLLPLR
jgi:hypothetical protein